MNAADLRALYADESSLHRMTSSAPPISSNVTETTIRGRLVYEVDYTEEPPDRIGQSMSSEMIALVAGIRADFTSYSPRHPIRRAMSEWERSCRRRHRPTAMQWRDHSNGPLCGNLLFDVVNGCSVRWCAERYGIGFPRAERLIAAGLRFVAERYTQWEESQLGIVHDPDHCETCIAELRDARMMRSDTAPA